MSAIARLFARDHFGIKLGLDNIRTLSAALGDPQHAYRTLIVGGTNGKGSVTAMVSTALQAAGHRVARYTSPHLVKVNERFAVDGVHVSDEALERALGLAFDAEDRCRADGRLEVPATFFELTTAAAFEMFRAAGATIAVLEVGLGGRFDATNVADAELAAITTVDLDHVQHLGPTIASIAFEKAGIVKPGRPVVVGRLPPDARAVIAEVAAGRGASLVDAFGGVRVEASQAGFDTEVAIETARARYGPLRLGLAGRHQVDNAVVAVRMLEALAEAGDPILAPHVEAGLRDVRWPARLERIVTPRGPTWLLDAAHNPAGAVTLASYLRTVAPAGVPVVFAAMRDKDADSMLAAIAPAATRLVMTRPALARSRAPEELASIAARLGAPAAVVPAVGDALAHAATLGPLVVVCGSIYLLGEVRALLAPAGNDAHVS